jgi:hypothetical protein
MTPVLWAPPLPAQQPSVVVSADGSDERPFIRTIAVWDASVPPVPDLLHPTSRADLIAEALGGLVEMTREEAAAVTRITAQHRRVVRPVFKKHPG